MKTLKPKIKNKTGKQLNGKELLLVLIVLVLTLTTSPNEHPLVFAVLRPLIGAIAAAILLRNVKS